MLSFQGLSYFSFFAFQILEINIVTICILVAMRSEKRLRPDVAFCLSISIVG